MVRHAKVDRAADKALQDQQVSPVSMDQALSDIEKKRLVDIFSRSKIPLEGYTADDLRPIQDRQVGEIGRVDQNTRRSLEYTRRQLSLKGRFRMPKVEGYLDGQQPGDKLLSDVLSEDTSNAVIPQSTSDGKRFVTVIARSPKIYDTQTGQPVEMYVPTHIQKGFNAAVSAIAEERIARDRERKGLKNRSPLEEEMGPKALKPIVEMIVVDELDQNPEMLKLVGSTLKAMQEEGIRMSAGNFTKVWGQMREKAGGATT